MSKKRAIFLTWPLSISIFEALFPCSPFGKLGYVLSLPFDLEVVRLRVYPLVSFGALVEHSLDFRDANATVGSQKILRTVSESVFVDSVFLGCEVSLPDVEPLHDYAVVVLIRVNPR